MREERKAELMLILLTFIWGWTFPLMKISLNYIPPITFLTYRFGLAVLLMLLAFKTSLFKETKTILPGLVLGLTLFLGQGLQTIGLKYTTSSNSAFITSLFIVFTPFIGCLLIKEKIEIKSLISLSLALIGLYLISEIDLNSMQINFGDFLTLLCAITFAFQIVLVQKYSREFDHTALAFYQILWAFIFYLAYSLLLGEIKLPKNYLPWVGILYTSVFATVLGFLIQVKYQKKTKVQRAAIIYSAEPIFGHLTSLLLLGEVLSVRGYLGAFVILLAILWQELQGKKVKLK